MDFSPPGSSVHGISQERILEWVAISFSRGSSWPWDWTCVSCIGRRGLYNWATWEAPYILIVDVQSLSHVLTFLPPHGQHHSRFLCPPPSPRVFSSSHPLSWWCYPSLVQFSCSVVPDALRSHGPQHARSPCLSPAPGVYPNSCPLSWWCHPTISSSVIPFSFCPQSFPLSRSFQMTQLFASDGQSTGVSASTSVLPMNTQDWSLLGC